MADEALPEHIGPYRVTGYLGRGGMGEVLRGHDDRLDRPVALKRIHPGGRDPDKARQRFRREARVVARLSHQAIVGVYDWVEGEDDDWLVMELVDGQPLDAVLDGGKLPPERAAKVARQVASGLAAAHDAGLVHRDLKAANVMVTPGGIPPDRVKILDFGIAKKVGLESGGVRPEEQLTTLTEAGQVIGTVSYMSPEQALGYPVDHRSDLFALGILLYQMLAGVTPFAGDTPVETLSRICSTREVPLRDLDPSLPAGLAGLVGRLLEKQPERRPADAREVVAELDRLATGSVAHPPTAEAADAGPDDATLEMPASGPDDASLETTASSRNRAEIRTLLLSDLAGSTRLVERLGDERAAAVFEQHDRLARRLIAEHEGREIDKSDGFLILFSRPLAAVGFALAYHAALAELSEREGETLATRVGIHVGEVVVRENHPADVARGAKPLEVEGLAKAMAARFMSLAAGGQTLISRGVYDMARRAAVGVGVESLPEGLHWMEHGRYRMKGVEEPVAVFEVGVEGAAPLQAPADSEKVTRVVGESDTYAVRKASLRWGVPLAAAGVLAIVGLWGGSSWLRPPAEKRVDAATPATAAPPPARELSSHDFYQRGMALLERYDRKDNIDQAIADFQRALALDESSAPAHAGLARGYWLDAISGSKDPVRLEQALAAAQHAVALDEYLAIARVSLGMVYLETGRGQEAMAELERVLELEPLNADAYFGLGKIYEAQGQLPQAAQQYRRAIEVREDHWVSHSRLGTVHLRAGRYEEAEAAFRRSLEIAPDSFLALRNLGVSYYMQDKLAEAATQFQRALEIQPEASLYNNLGIIYFAQGRYSESVSAFKKTIDTSGGSNDYLAWANLGDAYRWTPDNESQAQDAYRRAIQLLRVKLAAAPEDATLRSRLAQYLAKRGDRDRAVAEIAALMDRPGNDASTWFRLTVANEISDRRDSAFVALELALRAGYSPSLVQREPELLKLRQDARYHHLVMDIQADDGE